MMAVRFDANGIFAKRKGAEEKSSFGIRLSRLSKLGSAGLQTDLGALYWALLRIDDDFPDVAKDCTVRFYGTKQRQERAS